MTNATGFLVRSSLSDTGTVPRTGDWTSCPDIIPAGPTAMSKNDLVSSYGSVTNKDLQQGIENFLYVRAKNMNTTSLTQQAYLFQVPGSLVLYPSSWFKRSQLVTFQYNAGTPQNPNIVSQDHQTLTADGGQIAVTDAYTWAPDTSEHHCLVACLADSWNALGASVPTNINSVNDLAQWIYTHASFGWHNVNILPITSDIYEGQVAYAHSTADADITFTMKAVNVPVGAKISFSSNTSTSGGRVIGQDWVTVTAPPGGGAIDPDHPNNPINPDFEIGVTVTIPQGYATIITYRTDFNGKPRPANFAQQVRASVLSAPAPAQNSVFAAAMRGDSFAKSFRRTYSATALFHQADGAAVGHGLKGFRAMMADASFGDDGGSISDQIAILVGSHMTTPGSS